MAQRLTTSVVSNKLVPKKKKPGVVAPGISGAPRAPTAPKPPSSGDVAKFLAAAARNSLGKPVEPFLQPEQSQENSDRFFQAGQSKGDITENLNKLSTDTGYQQTQIDRGLVKDQSATLDDAVARGIGQSSIKDGDIYDLQATAALRRNYLQTTLDNARIEGARRIKDIDDNWQQWVANRDKMSVANADAVPRAPNAGPSEADIKKFLDAVAKGQATTRANFIATAKKNAQKGKGFGNPLHRYPFRSRAWGG